MIPIPHEQLAEWGYIAHRVTNDGTQLGVLRMGFNWRLHVGMDYAGPGDSYCYKNMRVAISAMQAFEPDLDDDPVGWFKHVNTNRCRIHGDPARESVGWPSEAFDGDVRGS
jgi:hypothetical protein